MFVACLHGEGGLRTMNDARADEVYKYGPNAVCPPTLTPRDQHGVLIYLNVVTTIPVLMIDNMA